MKKSTLRANHSLLEALVNLSDTSTLRVTVGPKEKIYNVRARLYYLFTQVRNDPEYEGGKFLHLPDILHIVTDKKENVLKFTHKARELTFSETALKPVDFDLEAALHRTYNRWNQGSDPASFINSEIPVSELHHINAAWENTMHDWSIQAIPRQAQQIDGFLHLSFTPLSQ